MKDLYEEMKQDKDYMEWLKKYLLDYKSEYSGNLLNMYEAFLEGKRQKLNR